MIVAAVLWFSYTVAMASDETEFCYVKLYSSQYHLYRSVDWTQDSKVSASADLDEILEVAKKLNCEIK